jgi:predicted nucleotidyltransferase
MNKWGQIFFWRVLINPKIILAPFLFFLIISLISGCQFPLEFKPESEIRQEVLDSDPAFEEILQEKSEVDENIASLNAEQRLKAHEVESKILALKREQQISKEEITKRIASVNSQLDPYRLEIRQRIMEFETELKLKQSSLSAVRKMIYDLNKLVSQGPEQDPDSEDSLRLRDKIDTQRRQADILAQDIADLRADIRILRLKLKLLQ